MRFHPLADAVGLMVLRFLVILGATEVATLLGIVGWSQGLFANIIVTLLAIALVNRRRLWRSIGMTTVWRSALALLALAPLAFEAVTWALPAGVVSREPGYALWGLTLLLVGVNEELFARGLVLSTLERAYSVRVAVVGTGAIFGLQHLSAFALSNRAADDVLMNVLLSGIYGFALAAYQVRFRWIWPLILVHATADWVTILAAEPLPDLWIGLAHLSMVVYGIVLLRSRRSGDGTEGRRGNRTTPAAAGVDGLGRGASD